MLYYFYSYINYKYFIEGLNVCVCVCVCKSEIEREEMSK